MFKSFEWDKANIDHLHRHGIVPSEAEEVVLNNPVYLTIELRSGELRRKELGETTAGRVLIVVTVARGYKIRVVTGWPADRAVRVLWNELRGEQR